MAHRVLFFTDSLEFGGAEHILVNLIAGVDRHRWNPTIYYNDSPGIAPLVHAAQDLGVAVKAVPPMPLGVLGAKQALLQSREIRKHHPDIFHANLTWPLSSKYGLLAAVLARVPVVIAVLHSFVDIPYTRLTRVQLCFIARRTSCHIAVSHDMKDKIGRAFDLPKEKIQVIHNGIPIDPFLVQDDRSIRKSLLNDGTCPVILTTARLVEHKGLEDLLQAAVQVPDAMFLVAGDGPLRSLLETQAKALGVDERVVFLGYREDLNQLLLACDFFVLPSHNEGLPLSILEAMAAGKAVVATHAGGIGEAVIDGETGWLVPVADPDRLAASIRSLLADPKLARRFGRAGRERVLRAFHVDVMVKKYTSTYESLLRSKGVGSGA